MQSVIENICEKGVEKMTAEQKIKLNEYRVQILEGREKQPMADYVGVGIANKRKTDYNYSKYSKKVDWRHYGRYFEITCRN